MSKVRITMKGIGDFNFRFSCVTEHELWSEVLLFLTANEGKLIEQPRDEAGKFISFTVSRANTELPNKATHKD